MQFRCKFGETKNTQNTVFISILSDFNKARDGTRTRDPDLGKVVLHQLSHSRMYLSEILFPYLSDKYYYTICTFLCQPYFSEIFQIREKYYFVQTFLTISTIFCLAVFRFNRLFQLARTFHTVDSPQGFINSFLRYRSVLYS